jgi:cytochrome c oxidase cbb3-type subunit 4
MYTVLRELADSWVLLLMFMFFAGTALWVFRPGSRKTHLETANIPFLHEDQPAPVAESDAPNAQNKEA